MLQHIQYIIKELKEKIHINVEFINNNQKLIQNFLKDKSSLSDEKEFNELKKQNQLLMKQNNDFINVQLILIDLIKKYKDTAILKEDIPMIDIFSVTDADEIYMLTIDNLIEFDNQHPYFNNTEFIEKMMFHYKEREDFEKCHMLKKIKEQLAN